MREFNYDTFPKELLNVDIMNLVSKIHEFKGKEEPFIAAKPDILESMCEIAKIQSTGASNRIEGIYTSDERLEAIVKDDTIIYIEENKLDKWVYNKTIQKARESYRITDEQKEYLKSL